MQLESLPELVLATILNSSDFTTRLQLSRTCSKLHYLYECGTDFPHLDLSHYNKTLTESHLIHFLKKAGRGVRRLRVVGNESLTCRTLVAIAANCKRLVHLELAKCLNLGSFGDSSFSNYLFIEPQLSSQFKYQDQDMNRLESLDMSECSAATNETVYLLASLFPKLQVLKLGKCPEITDVSALAQLKHLRSIHLPETRITDDSLISILSSTSTPTLDSLSTSSHTSERFLPYIATVVLSSCYGITNNTIVALANTLAPSLQELDVSYCCDITTTGIVALAKCKNLTTLNVRNCRSINPRVLDLLADSTLLYKALDPLGSYRFWIKNKLS